MTTDLSTRLIAKAYDAQVEAFEQAYDDHISALCSDPWGCDVDDLPASEEENRKWANEHWDEVEAYSQRRPKEY